MRSKPFRLALHAVLLALGMAFHHAVSRRTMSSHNDRRDIEDLLKARRRRSSRKDADGHSFKRDIPRLYKVDDTTCTVTFHRHTALGRVVDGAFPADLQEGRGLEELVNGQEELQDSFQRLTVNAGDGILQRSTSSRSTARDEDHGLEWILIKDFEGGVAGFRGRGPDLAWGKCRPSSAIRRSTPTSSAMAGEHERQAGLRELHL
jgi:hypothetical protein